MRTVVVSGAFDPLHLGHVEFFKAARRQGDQLVVIVETDDWVATKHPVQQPQYDRCRLIASLHCVDEVLANDRPDGDCSAMILQISRAARTTEGVVYAVGADHTDVEMLPEYPALVMAGVPIRVVGTAFGDRRSSKILAAAGPQYVNPIPMVAAVLRPGWAPHSVLVATRADNGKRELPGGFVEASDVSLEEACRREVLEELGVVPVFLKYLESRRGTYRDGRPVHVTAFEGILPAKPVVPTEEVASVAYVTGEGNGSQPWDSEVDRMILRQVFAREGC